MTHRRLCILFVTVVSVFAATTVLAGDGCIEKLAGRWTFVPNQEDEVQVRMLADLGIVEFSVDPATKRWTCQLGETESTTTFLVSDCDGKTFTVEMEGASDKLIVTFVSSDQVSIANAVPGEADTPQVFQRKGKGE